MMPSDNEMIMEYDEMNESYYVIWEPMAVIGMGKTKKEALDDMRQAAIFGMNALIDRKMVGLNANPTG